MKIQKHIFILCLAVAAGLTCVYAAEEAKYSSKFAKSIRNCEPYQETINSVFEGGNFTTQRKITGWSNGYCKYEEIVKSSSDAYRINCNFSEIQLDDLYTAMKDKSKEAISFNLETFAEQKDAKTGQVKYKVIGSTPINGNSAYIAWTKYLNNPYFCKSEKIK